MKFWNLLLIFLLLSSSALFGQNPATQVSQDTLTRTAPIFYDANGYRINYGATMPPLNQIAGAPKAFYSYYWEMGDGDFSFEEKPSHTYKKKGEYEVRLWSTNNYDNGKPPESRPKKVVVNEPSNEEASVDDSAFAKANSPFTASEDLIIRHNREPVPEQEMVLIVVTKTQKTIPLVERYICFTMM